MFDVQAIKTRHDLRRIVESDLGPAHGHGSRALLWRCPFHNERKGYSLSVWPDNWRCFGSCCMGGDAISWLERYRGMTFNEACRYLDGQPVTNLPIRQVERPQFVTARQPKQEWQSAAWNVVKQASDNLWSDDGQHALAYLKRRGLSDDTIAQAQLGFVPGHYRQWITLDNLLVPCGITIPWTIGHELWAVKVRRSVGTPKYPQIAGGSASGLYNIANLAGQSAALFVEGEFDALLAEQESGGLCGVVTLGSAANKLSHSWLGDLLSCQEILVAYDTDEAGRKGAARLQALTSRVRIIQVPLGKDVTEFYLRGGSVFQWIADSLKQPFL